MLEFAVETKFGHSKKEILLYLSETEKKSFEALNNLSESYRKRGLEVQTENCAAAVFLNESLPQLSSVPVFFFLDPCGVGIPFEDLVKAANRSQGKQWPPTEILLNFSLDAVRRIGGHVKSPKGSVTAINTLSMSLGGNWWKKYFDGSHEVTDPCKEIVEEFSTRLRNKTGMITFAVPVRRGLNHQPIYYLIFGTRNTAGLWNFANAVAKSSEDWRIEAQNQLHGDQLMLDENLVDNLKKSETAAIPTIKNNILRLIEAQRQIKVGDFPIEIFQEHLGQVRESTVRKAIKELHQEKLTLSTGVGKKVEDLVVATIK